MSRLSVRLRQLAKEQATQDQLIGRQSNYTDTANFFPVYGPADLPPTIGGVITIPAKVTYLLIGDIDILGSRLVVGQDSAIIGLNYENCSLTSTGLSASVPLITSNHTLALRFLTITSGTALALDATANPGGILDWYAVNFLNCPVVGLIKGYSIAAMTDSGLTDSAELTYDGTMGSVSFAQSLIRGLPGKTAIVIPSTATFTRRFRLTNSAFVTPATGTGINVSLSAVIPDEAYILDGISFGGPGAPIAGVDYTSNKALFTSCFGITNSSTVCQYYMTANATPTPIAATGTFYKALGTTTGVPGVQKFDVSVPNRATYIGAFPSIFRIGATMSVFSGNNQVVRARFAKNGVTIAPSETEFETTGSGEAGNIALHTLLELAPTDHTEIFIANDTATTNITVKHLNVVITKTG
jgi:hypothetical protein